MTDFRLSDPGNRFRFPIPVPGSGFLRKGNRWNRLQTSSGESVGTSWEPPEPLAQTPPTRRRTDRTTTWVLEG